jgi:hypothetical protein
LKRQARHQPALVLRTITHFYGVEDARIDASSAEYAE